MVHGKGLGTLRPSNLVLKTGPVDFGTAITSEICKEDPFPQERSLSAPINSLCLEPETRTLLRAKHHSLVPGPSTSLLPVCRPLALWA